MRLVEGWSEPFLNFLILIKLVKVTCQLSWKWSVGSKDEMPHVGDLWLFDKVKLYEVDPINQQNIFGVKFVTWGTIHHSTE